MPTQTESTQRITYDLPSSLMAEFGSAEVNDVARGLDEKVKRILDEARKVADHGGAARFRSLPEEM